MTDKPVYMENLNCAEVYAETVQFLHGGSGILRIELCVNRLTNEVPVHIDRIVPVARVAISVGLARVLMEHLGRCLAQVEGQSDLANMPASPTKN